MKTKTEPLIRAALEVAVRRDGPGVWGLAELSRWPFGHFEAGAAGHVVRNWPTEGVVLVVDGVRYRARWERQAKRSAVVVELAGV